MVLRDTGGTQAEWVRVKICPCPHRLPGGCIPGGVTRLLRHGLMRWREQGRSQPSSAAGSSCAAAGDLHGESVSAADMKQKSGTGSESRKIPSTGGFSDAWVAPQGGDLSVMSAL